MNNATEILGGLLRSGLRGGIGEKRLGGALGSGGLGDLLSNLGGSDPGSLLGRARGMAERNPQLAAGGIGAIVGTLLGRGQPMGGAIGGIAMGLLGMVAAKALRGLDENADPQATQAQPAPSAQGVDEQLAAATLRAMIAAAKADGQVDDAERRAVVGQLDQLGLGEEPRRWVDREMQAPLDMDQVVKGARNKNEAAQLYAASLLAITVDKASERRYLDELGRRLGLSPQQVAAIHAELGVPQDEGEIAAAPAGQADNPWR